MITTSPTPPPWVAGSPGDKNHRRLHMASLSPASVDLALDGISATDLEREVVHLVCRVHSPRSALRVVAGFWKEKQEQHQTMVRK